MANSRKKFTMPGPKQKVEDFCEVCGKPCKGEDWTQKNPETGMRGAHWRCENGHVRKTRKYIVKVLSK